MRLTPPPKVEKLQTALHAKAKQSPNYRFYALYDKVYRADVLAHAYRLCRANHGSPGIDGQTFADVEAYGVKRWLDELAEHYVFQRFRQRWCAKYKVRNRRDARFSVGYANGQIGLVRLRARRRHAAWANA